MEKYRNIKKIINNQQKELDNYNLKLCPKNNFKHLKPNFNKNIHFFKEKFVFYKLMI